MIVIYFAVLFCGALASESKVDGYRRNQRTPRYLEAYLNIAQAKLYIQKHLPRYINERYISYLRDEDIAFGTLVAITGGLVQEYTINPKYYNPLELLEEYDSYGRRNYLQVVAATYDLIDEASRKVLPIINLMESVCIRPPYMNCNREVDATVRANPYIYYASARLFIHLGKISKTILRNQVLFDKLIRNNEVVSYFIEHANDKSIMTIISRMSKTYMILKRMSLFE